MYLINFYFYFVCCWPGRCCKWELVLNELRPHETTFTVILLIIKTLVLGTRQTRRIQQHLDLLLLFYCWIFYVICQKWLSSFCCVHCRPVKELLHRETDSAKFRGSDCWGETETEPGAAAACRTRLCPLGGDVVIAWRTSYMSAEPDPDRPVNLMFLFSCGPKIHNWSLLNIFLAKLHKLSLTTRKWHRMCPIVWRYFRFWRPLQNKCMNPSQVHEDPLGPNSL